MEARVFLIDYFYSKIDHKYLSVTSIQLLLKIKKMKRAFFSKIFIAIKILSRYFSK